MDTMSRASSTLGSNSIRYDLGVRKIELSQLADEELKCVLLFRPGARDDPSYRRIAISALEYMKDIKSQLADDIKNKAEAYVYPREPPDTDTAISAGSNSSERVISPLFLYPGGQNSRAKYPQDVVSPESSPTTASPISRDPYDINPASSTAAPRAKIESYPDLFREAARTLREHRTITIARIRNLRIEPLFDHMTQKQPAPFIGLQDAFFLIRKLEPDPTNSTNPWSWAQNSSTMSNEDIEHLDDHETWRKNFILFIHTANTIMGNFHGTLPYYWLNHFVLVRNRKEMTDIRKLPKIPTLQELDKSGYSISAFEHINRGIKVEDKNVSIQILSLLDFRYRNADMPDRDNVVLRYYRDSIIKLSKLIPNKRSFDVAVEVGMIPADMTALVDFTWWTNNVIKVGREVEIASLGEETYTLFVQLNRDYYNFAKSIKRDTNEQLKYNPVQLALNAITAILTMASLIFAVTGVIQVMQGFCVWEKYC